MDQIPLHFRIESLSGDEDYFLILLATLEFRYFMCLQISMASDPSHRLALLNTVREIFGLSEVTIAEWSLNMFSFRTSARNDCVVDDFGLEILVSVAANDHIRRSNTLTESHVDLFATELQKQIRYTNERHALKQLLGYTTPTN